MAGKVLVIASPYEAELIAGWLESAGVPAETGDGSDETLEAFAAERPDVVVVASSLPWGDSLSLISAFRNEHRDTRLVLLGDETGPVRTALDALDYGADRFLRRPMAQNALVFAVKSCLGPAAEAASSSESAAEMPVWREPTQILSGGAPSPGPRMGGPEAIPDAIEDAIPDAIPDAIEDASPDPPGGEVARARSHPVDDHEADDGTLVRELKERMSAIEKQLFGADTPPSAAEDDPPGDIDLEQIGVEAAQVLRPEELRFPGSPGGRHTALLESSPHDSGYETAPTIAGNSVLPVNGSLEAEDAAFLVARLAREGFSGKVTLRRDEAEKAIYFEEGRPVFASSNLPHDRMGDLLYREGKITREQHARSRDLVADTGRRMGEILVDIGFLKRRELYPAVRRHLEDIIYSVFAWDSGSYATSPGEAPSEEKIRLAAHPAALVLEGIRRKMGLLRIADRLPPSSVLVPMSRDDVLAVLADTDLSPHERTAIDLFDGHRTLRQVAAESAAEDTVFQLAYALVALGLFGHRGRGADRGHGEADPGVTSQVPAPLSGAADLAIDRERVLAKHAHVLEGDYFVLLGVRRDATAFEIRRAYEAARRDYAFDSFGLELQRELAEPLREIALVLEEAYVILKEDDLRTRYLANLRQ